MKWFLVVPAFLLLSPAFARSHVSPRFASDRSSYIRRAFVPARGGRAGPEGREPLPVEGGTGSREHPVESPPEVAQQQPKYERITIERLTEAPTPDNPKSGIFLNTAQKRWEMHVGPDKPNLRKAEAAWQRTVNSFLAHIDGVTATRPYLASSGPGRVAQRWDMFKTVREQWSFEPASAAGLGRLVDLTAQKITHVEITDAERSWYDLAVANLFDMKDDNRAASGWATHIIIDEKSGNANIKLRKRESSSVVAQLVPRPNETEGGTNYGPPRSSNGGNQSNIPGFQVFNVVNPNKNLKLSKHKMRSRKRQNPITTIITQEGNSESNNNQNSTADQQAQFELYLNAFYTAQDNITDAIWPFLNEITNGSNNSVVYDIAWSVWADLTAPNEYVAGPFHNGLHCLDSIEDDYAKANNLTNTSSEYISMLAMNKVLIDLYDYAWTSGIKAANASGLLKDFAIIQSNLLTNDSSIPPATFSQVGAAYDDSYFTTYNETMVPGS